MSERLRSAIRRTENKLARDEKPSAPHTLSLIFTVVPRNKSEFFADFLQDYEINAEYLLSASGTASDATRSALGIVSNDKAVIVGVIRGDMIKPALEGLEEKFRTVRGGKGIAFVTPMTSLVGVAVYQFLSNKEK